MFVWSLSREDFELNSMGLDFLLSFKAKLTFTESKNFQFTLQKILGVFQSNVCLQTVPSDGNNFTDRQTITSWKRQISN